jgi:hypothetical protein
MPLSSLDFIKMSPGHLQPHGDLITRYGSGGIFLKTSRPRVLSSPAPMSWLLPPCSPSQSPRSSPMLSPSSALRNSLGGCVPRSFSVLAATLLKLNLRRNVLYGEIPCFLSASPGRERGVVKPSSWRAVLAICSILPAAISLSPLPQKTTGRHHFLVLLFPFHSPFFLM